MSKKLTEDIKACVQATSEYMNDGDQRSAIGMADRWVATGNLEPWNPEKWNAAQQSKGNHGQVQVPNRDKLAQALVTILEASGEPQSAHKLALAEAREMINAPYVNEAMLGFQAKRAERGALGVKGKKEKDAA